MHLVTLHVNLKNILNNRNIILNFVFLLIHIYFTHYFTGFIVYSQTCYKGHLYKTKTCHKGPQCLSPKSSFSIQINLYIKTTCLRQPLFSVP